MHHNINVIIVEPDFSRTLQAYILPGLLDFLMLIRNSGVILDPRKNNSSDSSLVTCWFWLKRSISLEL